MEMMKSLILPILSLLLVVFLVGFARFYSPDMLRTDYSTKIYVNTPDKIENAISNVVSDLKKRDFVPVRLYVKWHPANKIYVISAFGIDRTKLGKYEP